VEDREKKTTNKFIKYSGLGIQMLGTIGIAAWLGFKLDAYLKFQFPVFLLSFVFLSFGGTLYQLYRTIDKD
jgi:hypothetical protein